MKITMPTPQYGQDIQMEIDVTHCRIHRDGEPPISLAELIEKLIAIVDAQKGGRDDRRGET